MYRSTRNLCALALCALTFVLTTSCGQKDPAPPQPKPADNSPQSQGTVAGNTRSAQAQAADNQPITVDGTTWENWQQFVPYRCRTKLSGPSSQAKALLVKFRSDVMNFADQHPELIITPKEIPIYFHIITSTPDSNGNVTGDISNAELENLKEVLNKAFADGEDSSCGPPRQGPRQNPITFNFTIKKVQRIHNDNWFKNILRDRATELDCKKNCKNKPDGGGFAPGVLHIFTAAPSDGTLGHATSPLYIGESDGKELDGIVCRYSCMPHGKADPYNEGDVFVHEIGHWLGLFHTFEGGCGNEDDITIPSPKLG